ncbi:hypothetical protein F5I97DRAFT_1860354 [Phlebopus sp. FC_14]|nr:hypothetical protein F5I97DRAFT_1860354 [Phlebopus sp. FC_14]
MLAGSVSATPRPRPPARSRRTSSHVKSSPPPYRATSHSNLPENSVGSVRSQSELNRFTLLSQSDQWTERSKEELSDLLHKADELIKDREHELDFTTAVCKSLYENNLELKNRHKALLARLPTSPASSPAGSSAVSPTSPDSRSPQSPHFYSANVSRTSSNESLHASRAKRHHRRVSVSPSDLALLSDQNAELLAKLEKLEAETTQADQAGRKKLRSLEKEIQGLREELERTRAKSDELEEKEKARVASGTLNDREEEVSRKKREREERFRALRAKTESDAATTEVRDFAPSNALSAQSNVIGLGRPSSFQRRRHISEAVFRPLRSQDDVIPERPRRVSLQNGLIRSASEPNQLLFPVTAPPTNLTHEYALVSQLLLKIRELEETNAQITEQQVKTAAQLQQVQQDAASIRLAYESLGDGDGVEWVTEEGGGSPGTDNDEAEITIRFASLRRSLSADPSAAFASEIDADMQSSLKHAAIPDHIPVFSHMKARRSVVGLFDSPHESFGTSNSSTEQGALSIVSLTIPGLPPVPFVPQPSNTSTTPSTSRSPSPFLDSSSLSVTFPVVGDVPHRRTLDSELCAAFDGTWEDSSDSHHFRTSSLINLTPSQYENVTESFSKTDDPHSPGPPILEAEKSTDAFASAFPSQGSAQVDIGIDREDQSNALTVPLQVSYETADDKKRRKSQTIRMRTTRWNEGRFGGTLLPSEKCSSIDISRPSTPIPERLANAFEAVVDTIKRSKSDMESSPPDTTRDDQSNSAGNTSVVLHPQRPRQGGIAAFVLEIWLWLQFVIIIVVFIWAMAKRGPKSVLEEAGRRRIESSKAVR